MANLIILGTDGEKVTYVTGDVAEVKKESLEEEIGVEEVKLSSIEQLSTEEALQAEDAKYEESMKELFVGSITQVSALINQTLNRCNHKLELAFAAITDELNQLTRLSNILNSLEAGITQLMSTHFETREQLITAAETSEKASEKLKTLKAIKEQLQIEEEERIAEQKRQEELLKKAEEARLAQAKALENSSAVINLASRPRIKF